MSLIPCPGCSTSYENDEKERRIPINGWEYHVCPACYLAYLKVRVQNGERLTLDQLNLIGKVRQKFLPGS
jgi:hypothetical protein